MFEVLNRERMKEVSGLLQLVGVLLGFGVMLLIEIFGNKIQMFALVGSVVLPSQGLITNMENTDMNMRRKVFIR